MFDIGNGTAGKYKLIYDRKSLGDVRLLESEVKSLKNMGAISYYLSIVLITAFSTGTAAYLTFNM